MLEQNDMSRYMAAYHQFLDYLAKATASIPDQYMLFPVSGQANPIYRERVYCYELYHQLRVTTGDNFAYSLGGEVDKAGHPILSNFDLDKTKPDLLVHKSGGMDDNLIVMEVKPVKAKPKDIRNDLQKMTSFVRVGRYYRAIYLVYGGNNKELEKFRKKVMRQAQKPEGDQIDLQGICLYWHQSSGGSAIKTPWGPSEKL